ncbi:MAG: chloride channel protein [Planctomycetota bacterium]
MAQARGNPVKPFWLYVLAAAVGGLGGLLNVGFQKLLVALQALAMGDGGDLDRVAGTISVAERLVVPTLGGLLAALCLRLIRDQRGPFGITDAIELVATRKGTIRPLQSLVQIVSSACSISTGASIGKEAANSQLAATVAATFARVFRADTKTRAVLLGCGIAAGMSCAYSAPIASSLFVMEVVLGNFAMDIFAPIVVAAVCAMLVNQAFLGKWALLEREVTMDHPALVLSVVVLGVVCAFGSLVFRHTLQLGRALFLRSRMPLLVALPLGGLLIGAIGVWLPQVWGNGRGVIETLTAEDAKIPAIRVVAALVVLKVIGTAISTGSGALGGMFTPNLVVGAALGSFFGSLLHAIAPSTGDHRVAFALVGMAGLCSATAHAPITAVLIVFEMTRDYGLMLPVMLCSIVGSVIARILTRDSIYTARLRAKGHTEATGIEELALSQTFVRDLMLKDAPHVRDTETFDAVVERFTNARRDSVFVVDTHGSLLGHVHLHDVKLYMNDPTLASVVIAGDLSRATPSVTPDESLAQVLPRFDDPELDELAVVDNYAGKHLIGRVTRRDVIACLSDEVLRTRQLRAKVRAGDRPGASYLELPRDSEIARIQVSGELEGRALDSLELHGLGVIPLFVVRRLADGTESRTLAEPQTELLPGSELVVLGPRGQVQALGRPTDDNGKV